MATETSIAESPRGTMMLSDSRLSISICLPAILFLLIGCGGGGGSAPATAPTSTAPVLGYISPSTATTGAAALTLTASGSNFISTSQIEWNGTALATTFVNALELTAQVPSSDLATGGTPQVTVLNPGSGGGTSNAMTFTVSNSLPHLASLSPDYATAGVPYSMTATGTGFVSNSQVQWNGTALVTSFVSSTQLTAQVPVGDLAEAGTANVSVSSPTPGGGQSSLSYSVVSGATRVKVVSLVANEIVWDAAHGQIYASLPSATMNGASGNSVVAINPMTGVAGTPQPAGSNPNLLTLSSDASHLWVGEDGDLALQRFTVPGLAPEFSIALPPPTGRTSATKEEAISLGAAPVDPHTVAVSTFDVTGGFPWSGNMTIYDDATPRAMTSPPGNGITWLQWGADDSTLYSIGGAPINFNSEGTWAVMQVDSSGPSLESGYAGPQSKRFHFDKKTGYLYGDQGEVMNPATGDYVGNFNLTDFVHTNVDLLSGYGNLLCVPDSAQGLVFFLGPTSYPDVSVGYLIESFDQTTYQLVGKLAIPDAQGAAVDFIRWGNSGLAFNTAPASYSLGAIYIVDGNFVNATGTPDFSTGRGAPLLPTLKTLSPQIATAGSGAVTLTVTGSNYQNGAVVYWALAGSTTTVALPTVFVSATQLQATIPASDLAAAGTAYITLNNGTALTAATNNLAFTVTPAASGITALNLASLSVAWDKKSALLYAAVWSADPQYPNSIIAIDPTTGQVVKSQMVGSDPYLVRTAADGAYLYTAFARSSLATRVSLPGLSSPLSWSLGNNPEFGPQIAEDLQPAPGSSQTLAISLGSPLSGNIVTGIPGASLGDVVIFDNNVARPNRLPTTGPGAVFYFYSSLQWGADGSTLYAANNESAATASVPGDFDFYTANVDPSGVTLTGDYPGVVDNPQIDIVDPDGYDNFLAKIHYDAGTGRVYDDNELIIDPAKGAQVGAFTAFDTTTVGGPFWQNFSLAVPDSSLNLVFILGRTYAQQISGSDDYTIESWNQKTQTLVNTITLPNVVGIPVGFIRWGASGLAIVTYDDQELPDHGPPGMLYIVNNPAFVTAAAASTPGEGKVGP